jgi:hypothetical protein
MDWYGERRGVEPLIAIFMPSYRMLYALSVVFTASTFAQPDPSVNCELRTSQDQCLVQRLLISSPDARPMMRWWWFGVAADKAEILRELQQMKNDGIGGVELAFVYPQVLDNSSQGLRNDPFVSPDMLENVRYAQEQARKLGLRVDVTLGSGWPYGGKETTLDEAAHRLRVAEIPFPANTTQLPKLKLMEGESVISVSIVHGPPQHWDAVPSETVPQKELVNGTVQASNEARTALFFIDSHTRQMVKRAAVGAEGWVLDPFQRKAIETHLKTVGEPLVKAFGTTPPYAIFSDSLEAYGADWTPALPAEFKKRRGYDLLPHLPQLLAGGSPEADTVRHDWGKTLTELVNENYLTPLNSWAIAHHTKFRSQTYGEPAVSLSSQRLVALPEGEGPYWRQFNTLRWATSANHLFGNNVTSAETFTWLHSPVFRATPLDMKAEADLHFIIGTNQIIGHGWPYSAPQVGEPGWSLYAAAVFNDHNPWHPVMPAVSDYIQRVSTLLRRGKPANQVAVLLPTDDAWASFTPGHVTVTGALAKTLSPKLIPAILDAGYNFDFIDADAIAQLGIQYPVLIIPATERIPQATLRSIQRYVARGGKVICVGKIPTISSEGKENPAIADVSKRLFREDLNSFVSSEDSLGDALRKVAIPDLKLTTEQAKIGFIRRKLPNADIYFLANTSNLPIKTTATFASVFRNAELVDPASGEVWAATKNSLTLNLAPYESRIVFISNAAHSARSASQISTPLLNISDDWKVRFKGIDLTKTERTLSDWSTDASTKNYSGEAIYERTFNLDTVLKKSIDLSIEGGHPTESYAGKGHPGMQAWYEGPIREAAIVMVNGQQAGFLWHPPYRLDITKFVKVGQNHIELHVYNTALNAWSSKTPHDYKPLIERYGDRFQMQDLDKVQPISSGIIGQILLTTVQ